MNEMHVGILEDVGITLDRKIEAWEVVHFGRECEEVVKIHTVLLGSNPASRVTKLKTPTYI